MVDDHQILFNRKFIKKLVKALAKEIDKTYVESIPLILSPVMIGGMYFCTDLSRELKTPHIIVPCRCNSYVKNLQSNHWDVDITNFNKYPHYYNILLVDELIDTGRSFEVLLEDLKSNNYHYVKTCSLLMKHHSEYKPDFCGVELDAKYDDSYLVGYGLDDADCFRNLTDIYIL